MRKTSVFISLLVVLAILVFALLGLPKANVDLPVSSEESSSSLSEYEPSPEPVLESSSQANTEPSQSVFEANEGKKELSDNSSEALEANSVGENGTGENSESDPGELVQNEQQNVGQTEIQQAKVKVRGMISLITEKSVRPLK